MSAPSLSTFSPAPTLATFAPTDPDPSHLLSILKMFSADKKRVETALESCGLNFNRVRRQGQEPRRVSWRVEGLLRLAASWVLTPTLLIPRVSPSGPMTFPWKSSSGS